MTDNAEQIEFWNGQTAETWVRAQQRVDDMLAELSAIAVAKADAREGERVIDVGCGCGATSLALAEQGAQVWGIDISAPMLARAKERAAGMDNVAFAEADAASQALTPDHQLIFSRFGVMFFADPVAAFTNLHAGLCAEGRLVFLCWQAPAANPWIAIAGKAIAPFLPEAEPVDPRAPGPFAFADADYLRGILEQAGFTNVSIDSVTVDMHVGDDLESAMRSQSEIGPAARALTELEGDDQEQALAAVRAAFEPLITDKGLDLAGAAWLVSASR